MIAKKNKKIESDPLFSFKKVLKLIKKKIIIFKSKLIKYTVWLTALAYVLWIQSNSEQVGTGW